MLSGIKIKNYALLEELVLGLDPSRFNEKTYQEDIWQERSLGHFTVLIGQNSSGKTSFFEALNFLSNVVKYDVQIAANRTKQGSYFDLVNIGMRNGCLLEFDLLFQKPNEQTWLRYAISIGSDNNYRPFINHELIEIFSYQAGKLVKERLLQVEQARGFVLTGRFNNSRKSAIEDNRILDVKEPVHLTKNKISALTIFGRLNQFNNLVWIYEQLSNFYFPELLKSADLSKEKIQTGGHKHLNKQVTNVENVLQYFREEKPKEYKSLIKRLNENLPSGNKINLDKSPSINGAGNLKLLVIYLILADQRPIIALDEPDAGLYYDMIDALLVELRDYSIRNPNAQVFISTHNPNVLDAFSPKEVWSFDKFRQEDDQLRVVAHYVGDDPVVNAMYEEGVGLGSLWYGGYLDIDRQK